MHIRWITLCPEARIWILYITLIPKHYPYHSPCPHPLSQCQTAQVVVYQEIYSVNLPRGVQSGMWTLAGKTRVLSNHCKLYSLFFPWTSNWEEGAPAPPAGYATDVPALNYKCFFPLTFPYENALRFPRGWHFVFPLFSVQCLHSNLFLSKQTTVLCSKGEHTAGKHVSTVNPSPCDNGRYYANCPRCLTHWLYGPRSLHITLKTWI